MRVANSGMDKHGSLRNELDDLWPPLVAHSLFESAAAHTYPVAEVSVDLQLGNTLQKVASLPRIPHQSPAVRLMAAG